MDLVNAAYVGVSIVLSRIPDIGMERKKQSGLMWGMMQGEPKLDGKIVAVSWNDAHFNTDEVDGSDTTHRPWVYVTAGILVKSDELGVTVAQDVGEDGKYRGRTFVPRAMVIQEWYIGPVKPKRKRKKKESKTNEENDL